MHRGGFRFAALLSLALAAVAVLVAALYDLPVRDPDGVAGKTYLRLPAILALAFLTDVLPRTAWRARRLRAAPVTFVSVVRERWPWEHVRFALVGLGAWYLTYAAFRNLKSYVPFVNPTLWDDEFTSLDRTLWLGQDPADSLHALLGTGVAAHVLSFVYIVWIVFVPASMVMALVWARNITGGAWYVTAVTVDWVLGVATYFALPTLGPIYASPGDFDGLAHTWVSDLQAAMWSDRQDVLADPFGSGAVQTIAAFASLHVGIMVTVCVMAELLHMHRAVRIGLWAFLGLTVVSTVYLGWHYLADAFGGAALGVAGVWIAALATGNHVRGVPKAVSTRRGAELVQNRR